MSLLLRRTPLETWIVEKLLILDWYDGPRAGLCQLQTPRLAIYFDLTAEFYDEDGRDDHLFNIKVCDPKRYQEFQDLLAVRIDLEGLSHVLAELTHEEQTILESMVASSEDAMIMLQTQDMKTFSRVWIKTQP